LIKTLEKEIHWQATLIHKLSLQVDILRKDESTVPNHRSAIHLNLNGVKSKIEL